MPGGDGKKTRPDFLFKFLVIGDANVGKSCLLNQFLEGKFLRHSSHTIGVSFGSKTVENINGKSIKLQIWDTAGQERYRSVTKSYYRGAVGCLLVYDITRRDTYAHLTSWLKDARSLARSDITIVLVGNMKDKHAQREVTLLEASKFANDHELMFIETSAKNGESCHEVFTNLATVIVSKLEIGQIDRVSLAVGVHSEIGGGENDVDLDVGASRGYRCCPS